MSNDKSQKSKIRRELEEIKGLKALDNMVKKSELESVFLMSPSRDSETVKESIADKIISDLEKYNKNDEHELNLLDRLVVEKAPAAREPKRMAAKGKGKKAKAKPKRKLLKFLKKKAHKGKK